jgi:hypothetical protein
MVRQAVALRHALQLLGLLVHPLSAVSKPKAPLRRRGITNTHRLCRSSVSCLQDILQQVINSSKIHHAGPGLRQSLRAASHMVHLLSIRVLARYLLVANLTPPRKGYNPASRDSHLGLILIMLWSRTSKGCS